MTNEAFADWLATATQADWTTNFPQFAPYDTLNQQSLADHIKAHADKSLRDNLAHTQRLAERLHQLAQQWNDPYVLARAKQIDGNIALIGQGEFVLALAAFEQAQRLFTDHKFTLEAARTAIGCVAVLARLGRFVEALATGNAAASVLDEAGQSADYARLLINLAMLHDQQGETHNALALLSDAKRRYQQLDEPQRVAGIDLNRAILLNYLGRFADSIATSQQAHEQFAALGQSVEAARALQGQADTYVLLGNYNRALQLFDKASTVYEADGRAWDSLYVQLHASQLLLRLGRYATVLERAEPLLVQFQARQAQTESADLLTYIGAAHRGLNNFSAAEQKLRQAHDLFIALENPAKQAQTELALAQTAFVQGRYPEALQQAARLAERFATGMMPIQQVAALLLAARASLSLGEVEKSAEISAAIASHPIAATLPHLKLQVEQLAAQIALAQNDLATAASYFARALDTLDKVSGAVMLEYRAEFMRDKETVYSAAVANQLRLGDVAAAFAIAERAKSRALVELLACRVDLSITARSADDHTLVQQFNDLTMQRNQLLRRQQMHDGDPSIQNTPYEIEQQLVAVRNRLLVRHADYTRDLSLLQQQVALHSLRAALPKNSVIIEFFVAQGQLYLFLLSDSSLEAFTLSMSIDKVEMLHEFWSLNVLSIQTTPSDLLAQLTDNARFILQQLHDGLIRPIATHIAHFEHLIFVPHAQLHYLPLHALHDGTRYLIEQHSISYLPSASVLPFCTPPDTATASCIIGYSLDGQLPFTVSEAMQIAAQFGTDPLLEAAASIANLPHQTKLRLLHLATHGDFRADNPLFSGLTLADGQLTTLAIFNMQLDASLVTLSACQTGLDVVGGGDELFGLTRAFLYAGAASLLLSRWQVHDETTASLLQHFYERLLAGETKALALQQAQLATMGVDSAETHPYFWAAFVLIGHVGTL